MSHISADPTIIFTGENNADDLAEEELDEEEPAEPSPFALRRAADERARAICKIAFERINVQDVQWYRLLPFIAERRKRK